MKLNDDSVFSVTWKCADPRCGETHSVKVKLVDVMRSSVVLKEAMDRASQLAFLTQFSGGETEVIHKLGLVIALEAARMQMGPEFNAVADLLAASIREELAPSLAARSTEKDCPPATQAPGRA